MVEKVKCEVKRQYGGNSAMFKELFNKVNSRSSRKRASTKKAVADANKISKEVRLALLDLTYWPHVPSDPNDTSNQKPLAPVPTS